MVQFGGTGMVPYMPMDREYHQSDPSPSNQSTNDVGVGIGDIGMSVGLGPVPNVQAVGAKMRAGTKTLELGFMGAGKGQGQQHTPEMYGKKQRQALREMQTANKTDFTTHSTVGVMGLAGMDQQGNFSKQQKQMAINEIKRAIDFASDVSRGGPVVVHTGEFQRPVSEAEWNEKEQFKMYPKEGEEASFRVVDSRTGGVIQEAKKNRKVARPVWNTAREGKEYVDFDGKSKTAHGKYDDDGRLIYLDPFGERVTDEKRVPRFCKEKQRFEVEQLGWNELKQEAQQMSLRAKEVWKKWKKGELSDTDFKRSYWTRFKDVKSEEDIKIKPEEAYIISTLETNAANSRGWAYYYGGAFDDDVGKLKKLRKALDFYEKIEGETDDAEKWRLKKEVQQMHLPPDLVPIEGKLPTDRLKEAIRDVDRGIRQSQEASSSQWAQAEESMETIRHVQSAESYAMKESYDAYADAGITAMKQSERLQKEGKIKKPLSVAMENLFPESYGSHPDELIKLVQGSREQMTEKLMQQGMRREKAKKEAQEHINATFDTGHFNMWRKYWQGDPNRTVKENDEAFNKWALNKVEDLAKAGVVNHLHIVDNYGYQDDHLAPGEGNTPIKDMVKIFKKHGYKGEMIVEPGADYTTDSSGFKSVAKTWQLFGSSIYGSSGAAPRAQWGDVQYGFFGQNKPAYFTFGGYSPSEDWTLWSGVPLE